MSEQRPNIIFIMTDQQRFDTLSALGYPHAHTPNLDRLVSEGASFTNAFACGASCVPSRASLFTAQYPHTTGIYGNGDSWRRSWVEYLADAGYHCVNIGKMHSRPFETPMGFHERFVVEDKDRYLDGRYYFDRWDMYLQAHGLTKPQRELYRRRADYAERAGAFEWQLPEDAHPDVFVGDLAKWWLKRKPRTEPLFLQIGFPGPHPPYDPLPQYADLFQDTQFSVIEPTDEDRRKMPKAQRELIEHNARVDHDSILWSTTPTREQIQRIRRYYSANVSMIDHKIGEILETLAELGYLEHSIVLFTSDHGDCLGDHGHIEKLTMYDVVTKVPLMIWGPRYFDGGRQIPLLCQQFDIVPALFELARLPVPDHWEARSLAPSLRLNDLTPIREYVYSEQRGNSTLTATELMTMIRSTEWKLVHYLGQEDGELYDMVRDPHERNNLWAVPTVAHTKQKLLNTMLEWRMRSALETNSVALERAC